MTIAVVIPAFGEAEEIAGAIESVRPPSADDGPAAPNGRHGGARAESRQPGQSSGIGGARSVRAGARVGPGSRVLQEGIEVVVVDGGSRDATIERAQAAGARVVPGPRGRSLQLQAGVDATVSDVVLFLHADSRLPRGWEKAVRDALADPETGGGAFRFQLDGAGARLRLVEWGVRLRVALLGLPYGDQAIFVRRGLLEAAGGIAPVALMEDLDLVAAIKARSRLRMLDLPVRTSARRYRARGVWRTVALHFVALTGWRLGVDRSRIARWLGR